MFCKSSFSGSVAEMSLFFVLMYGVMSPMCIGFSGFPFDGERQPMAIHPTPEVVGPQSNLSFDLSSMIH